MFVCVNVCLYVCMYCMDIYIYIYIYVCRRRLCCYGVCVSVPSMNMESRKLVRMYVCVYVCMYVILSLMGRH